MAPPAAGRRPSHRALAAQLQFADRRTPVRLADGGGRRAGHLRGGHLRTGRNEGAGSHHQADHRHPDQHRRRPSGELLFVAGEVYGEADVLQELRRADLQRRRRIHLQLRGQVVAFRTRDSVEPQGPRTAALHLESGEERRLYADSLPLSGHGQPVYAAFHRRCFHRELAELLGGLPLSDASAAEDQGTDGAAGAGGHASGGEGRQERLPADQR